MTQALPYLLAFLLGGVIGYLLGRLRAGRNPGLVPFDIPPGPVPTTITLQPTSKVIFTVKTEAKPGWTFKNFSFNELRVYDKANALGTLKLQSYHVDSLNAALPTSDYALLEFDNQATLYEKLFLLAKADFEIEVAFGPEGYTLLPERPERRTATIVKPPPS